MKKLLSKYYGVLIGLVLGVGLAALSYADVMKLVAPTMTIDPTVQVDAGGQMVNPPIQITGLPAEQGKEIAVCFVPEQWEQYVNYGNFGMWHPLNPKGIVGPALVIILSIILVGSVIALIVWVVILYRRGELDKVKKFIHR